MKRIFGLLCFLLFPLQFIAAQQTAASGMPTIEADFFTRLEKRLTDAVVARNLPALDSFLAQDFELRTSRSGGELTLRDEWLDSVTTKYKVRSCRITGLTIRQIGSTAIVNFFCDQQANFTEKDLSGRFFVVDIWQKPENDWKLLNRYSAGPEANRPNSNPKTKD